MVNGLQPTRPVQILFYLTGKHIQWIMKQKRIGMHWNRMHKREKYFAENPDSLVTIIDLTNQKTTAGLITEADWARINPMEAELDRKLSAE